MKEAELRKFTTCAKCGRKLGETGMPMFYTVRIERHGLDAQGLRRQQGLGMMLGGALAMAMGPDEEMTQPLMEPGTIMICERCGTENVCVAELAEYVNEKGVKQ